MYYILKKVLLLILINLAIVLGASAGPGDSGNPTGGFGNNERSLFGFSENNSIMSDPGPGEGPGGFPEPEDMPIDGGAAFLLIGGLVVGARKIIQRVIARNN